MMATLVGLFGVIALVLAAVGLYGVMSHQAGQRRTEIGIRLALGAKPASILSLILGEGLRLVGIGAAIGLAAAFAGDAVRRESALRREPDRSVHLCGRLRAA